MKVCRTLAIVILGLVGNMRAVGTETAMYTGQLRGDSAYGVARSDDGCRSFHFELSAGEAVTHYRGSAPVTERSIWASLWGTDSCAGTTFYGAASVSNPELAANLQSAQTSVRLTVYEHGWRQDQRQGPLQLGVHTFVADVTWTGVDEVERGTNEHVSSSSRHLTRYRWNGDHREAELTIAATLGGKPLDLATSYAILGSFQSGSIVVTAQDRKQRCEERPARPFVQGPEWPEQPSS